MKLRTAALLIALGLFQAVLTPVYATVSTETRTAGPYTGNDVTTSFAFTFKVFAKTDLVVTHQTGGVETVKTLDSHYSVSLNANQDSNPGGTITYPISGTPLSASETLTIDSAVPRTQGVDLLTGGPFLPNVIENALDRNLIISQQLKRDLDRSMKQPKSDATAIGDMPIAATRANKYLVFDADGDPSTSAGSGTDTGLRTDLASTTVNLGADLVGVNDTGSLFTATTVEDALQEVGQLNVINALTAETSPAVADLVGIYDASAGAGRKMTLENLLKVINGLTADGAPDGTADYVLTYDASASGVKKALLEDIGSVNLLSTTTASASAQADISLPSGYRNYMVSFDATVGTDNASLYLRVSQDNGSTFKAGASDYQYQYLQTAGASAAATENSSAAQIVIANNIGSAAAEGVDGEVWVYNPASSTRNKLCRFTTSEFNNAAPTKLQFLNGVGSYDSDTNAIDALRFIPSAGTISGTFKLYGYK